MEQITMLNNDRKKRGKTMGKRERGWNEGLHAKKCRFAIESGTLWFRTAKSRDVSAGPLHCPFAHSLTPLIHSLALHYLLCSRALLRLLLC